MDSIKAPSLPWYSTASLIQASTEEQHSFEAVCLFTLERQRKHALERQLGKLVTVPGCEARDQPRDSVCDIQQVLHRHARDVYGTVAVHIHQVLRAGPDTGSQAWQVCNPKNVGIPDAS
eukprot:604941-Amphidinium_carterae.1